jgi:hypothetical protein
VGQRAFPPGVVDAWRWAASISTPAQDASELPLGFLLYGFSMGAGAGLNLAIEAQRQGVPIAALASVDGATNFAYLYAHSTAFATQMRRAYGMVSPCTPGDAQWTAKMNVSDGGHDPQAADTSAFLPIAMRFSASSSDGTVNRANNSLLFYNKLLAANWPAEVGMVTYKGGHCALSHFRPGDTNAFFGRALARPSTATKTSSSTSSSTSTTESSTTTTAPSETTTTVPDTSTSVPDTTTSVSDTTTTVDTTPQP